MLILLALLIAEADGLALLKKGHYLEARAALEEAAQSSHRPRRRCSRSPTCASPSANPTRPKSW